MSLLLANFPPLTGRYSVGCHDIEWRNQQPSCPKAAPEEYCKSILMRLYYPASIKKGDHKANWITHADYAKGTRIYKITHTHTKYIYIYIALCDIAKLPAFLSNWLSGLASIKKTRFYKDAQVLEQEFPVIIFSHGLGGNRLIYSSICSDLASHGFIVAAIEHREGSASLAKGVDDEWIKYDNVPPEVWGFRHHQLRHRVSETELCLTALDQIAAKSRESGPNFKGKLNMKCVVMAGHSFGGATTVIYLKRVKVMGAK